MLKVGIVGAGTMGRIHAEAYALMKDAQLIGIAESRSEAAQTIAEKLGISAYSSMEDMIAAESPDIIDICLPTYLHKSFVLKAAQLGKHVICEKPMATTLEDARAMIEACRKAGVKLMIGHVLRFFPEYAKAKQMVDGNAVGKVGTVRMLRGGSMPTGWNEWYRSFDKSGGVILDLVIHDFDWLRWTFGEVERVYAKGLIGREALPMDHAFVSLRFKNGTIAHVNGSWAHPDGFRTFLEIAGKKGVISTDSNDAVSIHTSLHTIKSAAAASVHVPESPLGKSPYLLELEHFVDCVLHDKQPCITGEDAYKAVEISLAALQSIRTGRAVTLIEGEFQ